MHGINAWVRRHSTAVGAGLAVVAMALLAVAGVVLLRGIGEQVATTSAEPSATARATSTPTGEESGAPAASPTATSSEAPLWHGYQLSDIATPLFTRVWARVTVDRLNVREEASAGAAVAGVALRGDLLQVTGDPVYDEEREWAPVVGDGLAGWVATSDAEDSYLQPVATPWQFGAPRVLTGLVASDDGLLAYGRASDLVVLPYEGSGWRSLVLTSGDGRSWQEVTDLGGPASAATSAGGGAWVLANEPAYIEPNFVRVSADGLRWADPEVLSFTARSAARGPAGVVLMGSDWEGTVFAARVAADGTVEEVALPAAEDVPQAEIEASEGGYVAFDRYNAPVLLVSTDGAVWNLVSIPGANAGAHAVRDVELEGSRLIVVVVDTASGATELRFGQLGSGAAVAWETERPAPFGSATVDGIALGGGTFLAVGWDRQELVPRVWRSTDGRAWTDLGVDPAAFGGAVGPEPAFAHGRWYAATDAIYASDDGATWEEVFRPPMPPAEGPGCPPADQVTALDLMFLAGLAADCYRDAPLTFRAWITVADGLGGCCWPIGEPEWLNAPIPPGFLSSGPSGLVGSLGVYPVSDLVGQFRPEGWAQLTGHFHDPTAEDCRRIPLTEFPHRLEAKSQVVADCERRFVIDSVVRIDP